MIKKTACLLLLFAFLVSCCSVSAASFPDTKGTAYETAVSVLEGLDIVEGTDAGLYEPEKSVTRAEMAALILRTMGVPAANRVTQIFSDVPESHWAFATIASAYELGIINGVGDGMFLPDAPVSYTEGVKMVVSMLGYTKKAEALGGYPAGYLSTASQLALTNGISSESEAQLTRGGAAKLIYNALDVEMMEPTSYGADTGLYKTTGKTVLSEYMHIKTVRGSVLATRDAELMPMGVQLSESEILILENGTDVIIRADGGNTNVSARPGVFGTFYVKTDGADQNEVVAFVPRSDTEIITIAAGDILSAEKGNITYEEEEKKDSVKISFSDPTVIFNGSRKLDYTASDLMPEVGFVRVIKSGGNTTVLVESYENFVVNAVNTETNTVSFKEGESVEIDETDAGVLLNRSICDFKEWGVLSVARGDKKTKYMYSGEKITGKVTEISGDAAVIGGIEYPVARSLTNSLSLTKPALGQDCAYTLDFTGAVAAVNTKYSADYKYGILVSTAIGKGMRGKPQLKIFTEDGEMKVFDLTENVTYMDGVSETTVKAESLIGENAHNTIFDGTTKRQLVRYSLTESGVIRKIETAADYTYRIDDTSRFDVFSWDSLTGSNRLAITSDGKRYEDGIDGIYIAGDMATFVGRAAPRANTKFFVVPDSDMAEDKEYAIRAYNSLSHNNDGERYTNMRFYDIDDECIIGAMVWYVPSGSSTVSYPDNTVDFMCITAISKTINKDGEACLKLDGYHWKNYAKMSISTTEDFECLYKMVTADVYSDKDWYSEIIDGRKIRNLPAKGATRGAMFLAAEDLAIGDIIQYQMNAADEATVISVRYRADYPGKYEGGISNSAPSFGSKNEYYIHGVSEYTVDKVTDYGFITTTNIAKTPGYLTGETATRMISAAPEKILFLDKKKETAVLGTKDDVRIGDTLLRVSQTYGSYMLIVVRN